MKPRFRDVRDRLRFVGMKADDYDLSKFPDFLIIGPQRTGTTWLYENLIRHPNVFIPHAKEVHYFNNLIRPEFHPAHLIPVNADLGWYLEQFRVPERIAANRNARSQELFGRSFAPKVFGEATATYAAGLEEPLIEEILTLNPDIKIITMIRDPIERAWSHAKKDLSMETKLAVEQVPDSKWIEFFERPYQLRCGHYSQFLPAWQRIVPKDNLFIAKFIDIAQNPGPMLTALYELLGIPADKALVPDIAKERINTTAEATIPPQLRARLEQLYGDEIARLRAEGMI